MLELKRILGNDRMAILQECAKFKGRRPSKQLYNRIQTYIIACMYVCSPQGRPNAIDCLSLQDGIKLIEKDGVVLSTSFKTYRSLQ
jgi:hypothetical protein